MSSPVSRLSVTSSLTSSEEKETRTFAMNNFNFDIPVSFHSLLWCFVVNLCASESNRMYRRQPHLPPIPPTLLWNRTTPGRNLMVAAIGFEPTLSTGMNRVCYRYTKPLYQGLSPFHLTLSHKKNYTGLYTLPRIAFSLD